jgi:hypothetical protein
MYLNERVSAFVRLGDILASKLQDGSLDASISQAYFENQWFTEENVRQSLNAIIRDFLDFEKIMQWLDAYHLPTEEEPMKTIGLVMAGNIPLVGWHDLMCALISGNKALLKLSSKDKILPNLLIRELIETEPRFEDRIGFSEQLRNFDAIIATGSNNTLRYFEYYFGKYRHILRKNRNSIAILTGNESPEQLEGLGNDIMNYFGLGCRNVSALLLPEGYDFPAFFNAIEPWNKVIAYNKYANNYTYNKSLLLLNKEKHLDNGFLLLKESPVLSTPVSVINYQYYQNAGQVADFLAAQSDNIQCIVSMPGIFENSVDFGETQHPQLWDYADGVDVMAFLGSKE